MTGVTNPAPWTAQAPCRGAEHLFFPEGRHARHRTEIALRICKGCPFTAQCLQIAMAAEGSAQGGARYGVYGGRTPAERRRLWEARNATQVAA